jgi:MFS transporter, DHA2 family, methylenomycin A resistance protein
VIKRIAASLPLAVVLFDATVVAVLLPDIRLDLGSSTVGGLSVMGAYLVALGILLPLLAPLRGRALTVAGAVAVAVAAVVCATADSTSVLVVGRAVAGAGMAAVMAGAALDERRSLLAAVALPAAALAVGPLVGGVFAQENWWRLFLWAGVPLAAVAGGAALATAPHDGRRSLPADAPRLLALAAGGTAIVIALVWIEVPGWGLWAALLLAGVTYLRVGPLADVPAAPWAWAFLSGCAAGLLFVMPEYFQLARNLSGSRSGALMLAFTVAAVTAWAVARPVARRLPEPALALAGLVCAGGAFTALIAIEVHTRYWLLIGLLGLAGTGLGAAAGAVPRAKQRLDAVTPSLAGAALGLVMIGGAFDSGQDAERGRGASFEHALAYGVGSAAIVMVALVALGALALWQPRRALRPASSAAPPAAES